MKKIENKESIIFPFDEGVLAAKLGKSIHTNPYKCPKIPRTDFVRSEAWLDGFNQHLIRR